MRVLSLLLSFIFGGSVTTAIAEAGAMSACRPVWSVQLSKTEFRDFGIAKHQANQLPPPWMNQQGLVFLSSSLLAVYQVEEANMPADVEHRNENDGGGRYTLVATFLQIQNGKQSGTIRWTTNGAGNSRLYPTHDGRFLVVAGNMAGGRSVLRIVVKFADGLTNITPDFARVPL